jgi:hypothetical protein
MSTSFAFARDIPDVYGWIGLSKSRNERSKREVIVGSSGGEGGAA